MLEPDLTSIQFNFDNMAAPILESVHHWLIRIIRSPRLADGVPVVRKVLLIHDMCCERLQMVVGQRDGTETRVVRPGASKQEKVILQLSRH
jgi:hypothetical protein